MHDVQPLHRAALDLWDQLPLARHSEFTAKYFVNADIARCNSQPPTGSRMTREERTQYLLQAVRSQSVPPK